jgi:hypothetical protein
MPDFPEHHRPGELSESRRDRPPPRPWKSFRASIRRRWMVPLWFIDWLAEWAAFGLGRLAFLELLEYCSTLSLLVAVIFYYLEAPQRAQLRHYQAWQVINTAQGKGGSGGRIDALGQLNDDHIALVGVDVSDAFLQGVRLDGADLTRANLASADMRNAHLAGVNLQSANMHYTNLRQADLHGAVLRDADLTNADLSGADLSNVDLSRVTLDGVDLSDTDLSGVVNWKNGAGPQGVNIEGVRNAPAGFLAWAAGPATRPSH